MSRPLASQPISWARAKSGAKLAESATRQAVRVICDMTAVLRFSRRRGRAPRQSSPAPARFFAAAGRDARLRGALLRAAGLAAARAVARAGFGAAVLTSAGAFALRRAAALGFTGSPVAGDGAAAAGALSAEGVLRPQRPRLGGAASSSALHSSSVRDFGSWSFGMRPLRLPSVI